MNNLENGRWLWESVSLETRTSKCAQNSGALYSDCDGMSLEIDSSNDPHRLISIEISSQKRRKNYWNKNKKNQINKISQRATTRSEINWSLIAPELSMSIKNRLISVQFVYIMLVSYSMSHNYLCDVIVSKLIKMKIVWIPSPGVQLTRPGVCDREREKESEQDWSTPNCTSFSVA